MSVHRKIEGEQKIVPFAASPILNKIQYHLCGPLLHFLNCYFSMLSFSYILRAFPSFFDQLLPSLEMYIQSIKS